LAAAIAVPVVAQLAAAPLVAWHFSSFLPGAAASNLAIPWLLGPVVLASVAATAVAPLWPTAGGWLLDLVGAGERLMWLAGAPGRFVELVPPAMPVIVLVPVLAAGLAALLPGRRARWAAGAYAALLALSGGWWFLLPSPSGTQVELLPVADGLAARISSGGVHLLADGGGRRREAAVLLASTGIRRLNAILVSHGDEDHIGGLALVLRTTPTKRLVLPSWLINSPEAVPLLRVARRHGVRVMPVTRGSRLDLGAAEFEILWPPATALPDTENERSMVARVRLGSESFLMTSDIGRPTEHRLAESSNLACSILLVPHHGSRFSASPVFLNEASPEVALIAAGPENHHHHPSPKVLARLEERGIPFRAPILHGRCGAKLINGEWILYPENVVSDQ
jgi:competence protein ComEC